MTFHILNVAGMAALGQVLLEANSPNQEVRERAIAFLQDKKKASPIQYTLELSIELANEQSFKQSRQLAGLQIKNTILNLTSEDFLQGFWESSDLALKAQVRNNTLGTLASPDKEVRHSAAQAVASIAQIDVPKGDWPDILSILVTNAGNVNPAFKEASLMTLGFICEALPRGSVNKEQSDAILTAIVANMTPDLTAEDIKIVAIQALKNSLQIAEANFQNPTERSVLLNVVCTLCQNPAFEIRSQAFQVLCEIASMYYDYIGGNLNDLGTVTYSAIKQDVEKVALMAIEFWNVIGDIEKARQESDDSTPVRGYIHTAADSLTPLLLENIVKFEEDDDEWNLHKACGTTLAVVVSIVGDRVVDLTAVFVMSEIHSADPKKKISAALVLGSILEGPTEVKLNPIINSALTPLQALMRDENPFVRQTAAWAISKLCEIHYKQIAQPHNFNNIMPILLSSLNDLPKVACHSCWGLINLIDHGAEIHLFKKEHFEHLLAALLNAAYRTDAAQQEHNLQLAAYSAISTLMEKAPNDCIPLIEKTIPQFVNFLKQSLVSSVNENLHNFICSSLQSAFGRASPQSISDEIVSEFMNCVITLFTTRNTVIEEAIHAVGALAGNIEHRFEPYLTSFGPYLTWALRNQEAMAICKAGTMCVGDIARALGERTSNYLNDLIPLLLSNLSSDSVTTDVKIQSIESLADLASHTKDNFIPYLPQVLEFIESAANASVQDVRQASNPELFDYLKELREAILEFYVGLLQGLNESGKADLILGNIPNVVQYALLATQDQFKPNNNIHLCALGLIGDVASAYKSKVKQMLAVPQVYTYLQRFRSSNNTKMREVSNWAFNIVTSI